MRPDDLLRAVVEHVLARARIGAARVLVEAGQVSVATPDGRTAVLRPPVFVDDLLELFAPRGADGGTAPRAAPPSAPGDGSRPGVLGQGGTGVPGPRPRALPAA